MTVKDMLGRSGIVSREHALKILDEHFIVPAPPIEEIHISGSLNRVLAVDITSSSNLPEFDRSTMDGYAVRSADTFGAAESRPSLLKIVGDIPMGTKPEREIGAGEAMRIATGGALPAGADAVVMFEQTQPVDDRSMEVVKPVAPLENVVQAGDDFRKGETILTRGRRMRPQDMAALASLGLTRIPAFQLPKVAIISTGNEIVPADTIPRPGQIRDSNSYNLEGLALLAGGIPQKFGIVPDDHGRLKDILRSAVRDCSLVLMTGGSSVGAADMTARVVGEMGDPGVLVHGVSIKPGKPLIAALVMSEGRHVPVFGLPGHPAAVNICFELFVKPVLRRLTGEVIPEVLSDAPQARIVRARLARSIVSSPGREDHVRVMLEKKDNTLLARPVFGPSGLISTLVKAAGTVVVPVNMLGIEAGEEVDVRLF